MEHTLPGYTQISILGSGASGQVVQAVHEATQTPVAIKFLSTKMLQDQDFVAGFRAEAHLLEELYCPHIARLYEYMEMPDGAAIVMELVPGSTLRTVMRNSSLMAAETALVILKGSLQGMAAAHEASIIHRDYKPDNVMVTPEGDSKLVDFGIATRSGMHGVAAGTPAYMAPELWIGHAASVATDVYAATVTFFECLTGERPYHGTLAELASQHKSAPIPSDQVPEAVRSLVRAGMAKDPRERPSDARSFITDLETLAAAEYGCDWEEKGRRKLAALAALAPLLFPSPTGDMPRVSSTSAQTRLSPRPAAVTAATKTRRTTPKVLWGVAVGGTAIGLFVAATPGSPTANHHTAPPPAALAAPTSQPLATQSASTAASSPAAPMASNSLSASPVLAGPGATPQSAPPRSVPAASNDPASPTHSAPATPPPPLITMPDVVNSPVDAARQTLAGSGFSADQIHVRFLCQGPDQGVSGQIPAAGVQVPSSTAVTLSVNWPDCGRYTDQRGQELFSARIALSAAGFNQVEARDASGKPCPTGGDGIVVTQSPDYSGQYLRTSTHITLVVSQCKVVL